MIIDNCLFCGINSKKITVNQFGFSIFDGFPVSPGHSLIVPHEHISSFFELSMECQLGLIALVNQTKYILDKSFKPDAYNIGINDGVSAGQTIMHLHIHLIPRYSNDVSDPRGGVRWVIPAKANYWEN